MAVVQAAEEARVLGHETIGTTHLLLGLLWVDANDYKNIAVKALEQFAIDVDLVRELALTELGVGERTVDRPLPLSAGAREVLANARRQAMERGAPYTGPEHLLLAIASEAVDAAARILIRLGAELKLLRKVIVRIISRSDIDCMEIALSLAKAGRHEPALRQAQNAVEISKENYERTMRLRDKIVYDAMNASIDAAK